MNLNIPKKLEPYANELVDSFLLITRRGKKNQRLIGVAATLPGEGTSSVAGLLASSLSKATTAPVLLVDANFADPGQHQSFDVPLEPGLVDLLAGAEESPVIKATDQFHLLTAGGKGKQIDLLRDGRWTELTSKWREQYQFIIVDIPAMEAGGVRFACSMDGLVLVLQADRTRLEQVEPVKEKILRGGGTILGCVFNQSRWD